MAGERVNVAQEMQSVMYGTVSDVTAKMRELSSKYGNLPMSSLINAFSTVNFGWGNLDINNPYVQNRRVKSISSRPHVWSKAEVEEMLRKPDESEQPLREVEHGLEYTSYPLFHTRAVYQNLLTYHSFIAPYLVEKSAVNKTEFWREWKLLEKLRDTFEIKSITHEITGQVLQEGKVFYYPRMRVDKSHNKIDHAFMQQLPSDFTKIVGFNNKSKYTIAFDLMYFTHDGTDYRQFGDLFKPYMDFFNYTVTPRPKEVGTKYIYAAKSKVNLKLAEEIFPEADVYCQNGRWFFWVTLPIDKVFTFEIDDVSRNAISPFAGMFLDILQLSQLEALQMELLQNPLVALVLGEIPYFETKDTNTADQYKLSMAGRTLFESLFYQMTQATNTGGIGVYSAPFKDMKLVSLPEAPSATNIVSQGYTDTMSKAGLSGIIPVTGDTRAGVAQISLRIESQFGKTIYSCMERMMNVLIEKLKLKYDFRFHMFGDIATDDNLRESMKKDLTLGILSSALVLDALDDKSLLDDIAWSQAIEASGILDLRIPLITSYTSSPEDAGLPPQADPTADVGGRPEAEEATTDGNESDEDSKGEARFVS